MLNETQTKLATEIGQEMFDEDMASYTEEQLSRVSKEQIESHRQNMIQSQIERAKEFLNPEDLISRLRMGALDPRNKHWRKLFTGLTGVKLPRTVKGTVAAVREHIGAERYDQILADRKAKVEAKKQAEREKREAKQREWEEEIRVELAERLKADEPLNGEEIVDAAKLFGLKLHPRTVGMFRNRVVSIQANTARASGGHLPTSAYKTYRQLQELVK